MKTVTRSVLNTRLSVARFRWLPVLLSLILSGWASAQETHDHDAELQEDFVRGEHGGRLLMAGDFAVELTLFEAGTEPEFRAWASSGVPLSIHNRGLSISVCRAWAAYQTGSGSGRLATA